MKGNPKLDAIVQRPVKYLTECTARYPQIWREHDRLRVEYNKLAKWPQWCYAPSAVTAACLPPETDPEVYFSLATMAAWRLTKGIYLFDETMFDALWATDEVDGDLPVELLQRLPEWCVYIPFPTPRMLDFWLPPKSCYGVFAQLDWKREDGAVGLVLCLDLDGPQGSSVGSLHVVSFILQGDLSQACGVFFRNVDSAVTTNPELAAVKADFTKWVDKKITDLIRPVVSILLWLCSAKPEISGLDPLRGLRTKKTRHGVRHFNAEETRVYEVAYRIGAALRLSQEAVTRGKPGDGTHASPRPHIRKAHWQGFWTGPRASVGEEQPTARKLILKWIAPIAVCVGGGPGDTIIPTIHPVIVGGGSAVEERNL